MRSKSLFVGLMVIAMAISFGSYLQASSHREALAILSDPCVDNTDVYAWVSPGSHDKLYLMANYNGLHEPGQGNQQTRLCDNVLYQFHITRGNGVLDDAVTYQIVLNSTQPTKVDNSDLSLPPGGGKELLIQLGGVKQTYTITKVVHSGGKSTATVIGRDLPIAPNNIGPVTDRVAYGLGSFSGYGSDPDQFEHGLYNDKFASSFISNLGTGGSEGRAFIGERDDPYYLDEKGIFDIINLNPGKAGANAIPGGRKSPGEDVFAGFNIMTIALEIPTTAVLGGSIPHNGTCGDDTLLGVWASASRHKNRTLPVVSANGDPDESGPFVQVGREAIPLVDAGLIGVQDQSKYLRTSPKTDVANFGTYFLNPILVRDAEFLGIYKAIGLPQASVDKLKTGRVDILKVIDLDDIPAKGCHHVPIEAGKVGDVIRLDVATDSQFPNGRAIPGPVANKEQVDVSDVIISLVVLGNPAAGVGDGVNSNDKDYLKEFPWAALPWQGLNHGHGKAEP